jgi:hypothetical protein
MSSKRSTGRENARLYSPVWPKTDAHPVGLTGLSIVRWVASLPRFLMQSCAHSVWMRTTWWMLVRLAISTCKCVDT